jgi:hypothetical protein
MSINDVIFEIVIKAIAHITGFLLVTGIAAAFWTWRRSLKNTQDIDHAFAKLRILEGKINEREKTLAEQDVLD